jgi:hypothetical protein
LQALYRQHSRRDPSVHGWPPQQLEPS